MLRRLMTQFRGIHRVERPRRPSKVPDPVIHSHPPFGPCLEPPLSEPPSLPERRHDGRKLEGKSGAWQRWDCVAPAAYPRSFEESVGGYSREHGPFPPGPANETKEERVQRCARDFRELLRKRYEGKTGGEKGLYMAVEGWRRPDPGGGAVLVCTHANGMNKESWFPVIKRLVDAPIDEVWLLDDTRHGASVDLNAGRLGILHNWEDGGRDVVNFVAHVLPSEWGMGEVLPWHKEQKRRVIGVGHSFGANALVQAAHARPDLFEALFLVEPMCVPSNVQHMEPLLPDFSLGMNAMKRRTQWGSLAEAQTAFAKSPVLGRWHPEINEVWARHGFVKTDNGVTLATPAWAEAAVFAEPFARGVGWDKLGQLRVPVGSVIGKDSQALGTLGEASELVLRPPGSVAEVVDGAGHLLVQEDPVAVAECLRRFLSHRARL
ncbi:Alpha/Beta hydrolase protein [Kockovaella imperatae]|uniref:Alpha/Beta hydrolase protein n=1 Tax=Kockovaella imperatae TaxID=4999 RepID=A0A1Y1U7E1_9TREE|nr:Alpha/Beta hydrolase protein [Kockovaella imperatae]ORX33446.1 Alpha/Beta hydrolase protein [Kockovaella imperatae]